MYHRILMPYDGSEASTHALKEALALAKDQAAQLRIIHIIDVNPPGIDPGFIDLQAYEQRMRADGQEVLDKARQIYCQDEVTPEFALIASSMPPSDAIVEEARRWPADLIVMGTHGRSGLSHLLMGSVAESVFRKSPEPVLLFRDPGEKYLVTRLRK